MQAVYLASSFRATKLLMRQYAADLLSLGYTVTSRWIVSANAADPLDNPDACREAAEECLTDVDAADTLVYFTEHGSVGKHVEFGYAVARGKRIVVVGAQTSVFQFLPGVRRVPTWQAFLEGL